MSIRVPLYACAALALAGCVEDQLWAQAGADAATRLAQSHPERRMERIDEVLVGDGWDDGAELTLVFTSVCRTPAPDCRPQVHRRTASYQKRPDGLWRAIG